MKQIEHYLKFITELDENDPTAKRLLSLSKESQIAMLEGMLKQIIAPKLKPILDEVNANNSFALLRVVE
jgi:F0F1-type ATP synthase delta subunit